MPAMTPKKPLGPLVFGILNLVFGTLQLLANLCCGVLFASFYMIVQAANQQQQQAAPQNQVDIQGFLHAFSDNLPGFLPIMIGNIVFGALLAIMQVISGIGLVMIRSWGRWLCVVWSVLEALVGVGMLIYVIAVMAPAGPKIANDAEKWMEKIEEKQRQQGQNPPLRQKINANTGTGNLLIDNAVPIMSLGFNIGYAAVAFIFMVLPQTGRGIARYHGRDDGLPQDDPDHLYDDADERQRRRQDPSSGGDAPPGF